MQGRIDLFLFNSTVIYVYEVYQLIIFVWKKKSILLLFVMSDCSKLRAGACRNMPHVIECSRGTAVSVADIMLSLRQ